MLTQAQLKEELVYRDGKLFWKRRAPGRRLYEPAGSNKGDYRSIKVLGQDYLEHRLVWLYFYGKFPEGQLDHENRKGWDNRIENLCESTTRENNLNKDQSDRKLPHNIYKHSAGYRVDILYKGTRYKSPTCKTVEEALKHRKELLTEAGL